MTKEQKNQEITDLVESLKSSEIFYLSDTSSLNAEATSQLRRECFKAGIKMRVVKKHTFEKSNGTRRRQRLQPTFRIIAR